MKEFKRQKGITLIALVVTIIVLLILAGISIQMLTGQNGILRRAQEAAEQNKIAEYIENIELSRGEVALDNFGTVNLDDLINKIYENGIVPPQSIMKLSEDENKAKMLTKEGLLFIITADKTEYKGKGEEVPNPPNIKNGDIEFHLSPEGWTNENVEVSITMNEKYNTDIFTLQYSYDGTKWNDYTSPIKVSENNTTIYATIRNAIGEISGSASKKITIIDRNNPKDAIIQINKNKDTSIITTDTVNATITLADNNEQESGINVTESKWVLNTDSNKTIDEDDFENAFTGNDTTQNITFSQKEKGTYYIHVLTIDNAKNKTQTVSEAIEVKEVKEIQLGLDDGIILIGGENDPNKQSGYLELKLNTTYRIEFDYYCLSGVNKFDVDLWPDDLPQALPDATTETQHFFWETSSDKENMKHCRLRFFDDRRVAGEEESNIIISNIKMYEIIQ